MSEIQRVYKIIGDKIAQARISQGMTQLELVDFLLPELKLNRTSITHIENGKQRIMLHDLITIFQKLGIKLNFELT